MKIVVSCLKNRFFRIGHWIIRCLSYKKVKQRCHLKNIDAPAGATEDFNYESGERCCSEDECIHRVRNSISTRYDKF